MSPTPIVSPAAWTAARQALLVKEKEHTRARDALAAQRRRMPRMAVEQTYTFDGPDGPVEPARPVRGPQPADRLPLLLRAGRLGLARQRLPRLLADGRSDRAPRPPQRARHHLRPRLARAAGRHRTAEGEDGLGRTLVHDHRRLRRRLRRRRVARHERLPPRRVDRSSAPTSSTPAATRPSAARGATSTSRRSDARRSGRTRRTATRSPAAYEWWRRHDEYEADLDPWGGQLDEKRAATKQHARRVAGECDVIAHVAGLPVEELPPGGRRAGSALMLVRSRLAMRLRRPKREIDDSAHRGER